MATKVFLTSGTTWTVPSDWNSASNTVECIGGGGGGTTNASNVGTGGEGGHYAKSANLTLTPGAIVTVAIGLGATGGNPGPNGGSTWFNGASLAASSCGALGGAHGTGTVANATAATTNDVGNVVVRQGGFGSGWGSNNAAGAGGGGAAGPGGVGGGGSGSPNVAGGGGGGAGNTGGAGVVAAAPPGTGQGATGGKAGDGTLGGVGGLTSAAIAGVNGSGGGGGSGTTTAFVAGAVGGPGFDSSWDATHGPGGGGGGGGKATSVGAGGGGGLYGGGGGGSAWPSGTAGAGAQGIIVITYTPAAGATVDLAGDLSV